MSNAVPDALVKFQIMIKTLFLKSLILLLSSINYVLDIKQKSQLSEKIFVNQQNLILGNKSLEDLTHLYDYNIVKNPTLTLVL
jgi:hypothetical protein